MKPSFGENGNVKISIQKNDIVKINEVDGEILFSEIRMGNFVIILSKVRRVYGIYGGNVIIEVGKRGNHIEIKPTGLQVHFDSNVGL